MYCYIRNGTLLSWTAIVTDIIMLLLTYVHVCTFVVVTDFVIFVHVALIHHHGAFRLRYQGDCRVQIIFSVYVLSILNDFVWYSSCAAYNVLVLLTTPTEFTDTREVCGNIVTVAI